MPVDFRRIAVPEGSRPAVPAAVTKAANLLKENNLRQDGRQRNCLRPVFTRVGVVTNARGSAYIEMGATKVIASVYGPRELNRRDELRAEGQLCCEVKFATFSCRSGRRAHQQESGEKELSDVLTRALLPAVVIEEFPKARLDVNVLVLENDGGCCAAAVTVAGLALASAGIHMYDLVLAASLKCYDDVQLIDPTEAEENHTEKDQQVVNDCVLTVAYMPSLKQVSNMLLSGKCNPDAAKQGLKKCIEVCDKLLPSVQSCLIAPVTSTMQHIKS